jgi:hypothetical protein
MTHLRAVFLGEKLFKAGITGLVLLTGCATTTPTLKDSVEIDFEKFERWYE